MLWGRAWCSRPDSHGRVTSSFVDDRLEDFGQAGFVRYVPAEGLIRESPNDEGRMTNEQTRTGRYAELFFFVVGRQEDLAVLVEAACLCVARRQVNQTFDSVGRVRSH
jgi:hypothetical protein